MLRVMITGGNANNEANTGFFYFNGNNASSNANQNIGTRLNFYNNIHKVASPLGEIYVAIKVLVG